MGGRPTLCVWGLIVDGGVCFHAHAYSLNQRVCLDHRMDFGHFFVWFHACGLAMQERWANPGHMWNKPFSVGNSFSLVSHHWTLSATAVGWSLQHVEKVVVHSPSSLPLNGSRGGRGGGAVPLPVPGCRDGRGRGEQPQFRGGGGAAPVAVGGGEGGGGGSRSRSRFQFQVGVPQLVLELERFLGQFQSRFPWGS